MTLPPFLQGSAGLSLAVALAAQSPTAGTPSGQIPQEPLALTNANVVSVRDGSNPPKRDHRRAWRQDRVARAGRPAHGYPCRGSTRQIRRAGSDRRPHPLVQPRHGSSCARVRGDHGAQLRRVELRGRGASRAVPSRSHRRAGCDRNRLSRPASSRRRGVHRRSGARGSHGRRPDAGRSPAGRSDEPRTRSGLDQGVGDRARRPCRHQSAQAGLHRDRAARRRRGGRDEGRARASACARRRGRHGGGPRGRAEHRAPERIFPMRHSRS